MIQVLAIRKTKYLNWQLPKAFMDDDVEIPFQFRNMFYEQCFGKEWAKTLIPGSFADGFFVGYDLRDFRIQ